MSGEPEQQQTAPQPPYSEAAVAPATEGTNADALSVLSALASQASHQGEPAWPAGEEEAATGLEGGVWTGGEEQLMEIVQAAAEANAKANLAASGVDVDGNKGDENGLGEGEAEGLGEVGQHDHGAFDQPHLDPEHAQDLAHHLPDSLVDPELADAAHLAEFDAMHHDHSGAAGEHNVEGGHEGEGEAQPIEGQESAEPKADGDEDEHQLEAHDGRDRKHRVVVNQFATQWLHKHYEPSPHTTIQRTAMFASYNEVCEAAGVKPVNAATFGKSIRAAFAGIRTRRLGVRGNSKYNYCGIKPFTAEEIERLERHGNGKASTESGPGPGGAVTVRRVEQVENDGSEFNTPQRSSSKQSGSRSARRRVDDEDDDDEDEDEEMDDDDDELEPASEHDEDAIPYKPATTRKQRVMKPKLKPSSITVIDLEVGEGNWVPHVDDGTGKMVPCDLKGNPLNEDGTVRELELPAEEITSAGRPKRTRASMGKSKKRERLSDDDEDDDDDDYASSAPATRKRGRTSLGGRSQPRRSSISSRSGPQLDPAYIAGLSLNYDALRDSVPALRVLFRTTTDLTEASDARDPETGLVDGLEVPATESGHLTVVKMAKDYINHLQRDREKRIRETKALEEFIKTLEGGEAALTIWRQDFDEKEKSLAEQEATAAAEAAAAIAAAAVAHLEDFDASQFPADISSDPAYSQANLEAHIQSLAQQGEPLPVVDHAYDPNDPAFEPGPSNYDLESPEVEAERKAAKLEEARARNRQKQAIYRQRQKEKLHLLESQIKAMEKRTEGEAAAQQEGEEQHDEEQLME